MTQTAVFFAEYPLDYVLWRGIARILKDERPDVRRLLVTVAEPYSAGYVHDLADLFDDHHELALGATYGAWNTALSGRTILAHLLRNLPRAVKVAKAMREVPLPSHGVAFVYAGHTLNRQIFLRHARDRGLTTVVLADETPDVDLADFYYGRHASTIFRLYNRLFGVGDLDLYWMKVPDGDKTSQRELRIARDAADHVIAGDHISRVNQIAEDRVAWPFLPSPPQLVAARPKLLLIGGSYMWEGLVRPPAFYRRYNALIDALRKLHPQHDLVYMPHPGAPGEAEAEMARLDLNRFEVGDKMSPEEYVRRHPEVNIAYSIFSTCIHSLAAMGVQAHALYGLFHDDAIDPLLRHRLDQRWASQRYDKMVVRDEAAFLAGRNVYKPADMTPLVEASVRRLLNRVGIAISEDYHESTF